MLHHPCILRGPQQRGTTSKEAQKRAKMLHHARILGDPQQTRQNQSGIKRGQKRYITPAFLGIPNKRHKIRAGPKEGGNATSAPHSRGSPTNEIKSERDEKRAKILHHPCGIKRGRKSYITPAFLGIRNKGDKINVGPKAGRKEGGNATSLLHSRGSPTNETKSKRAEKSSAMLHHPCILGGPEQTTQNQSGPKRGRKCYITPAFYGVPNKGGPNQRRPKRVQKCYITPAFSEIPNKGDKIKASQKEGGNATSHLHSRGSPTNETKSKRAQKRGEILHHPCILVDPQQTTQNQSGPKRGGKCYITPAFSGVPNKRDKIKAGRKESRNTTSPLHSRGSPTKGTKSMWAQKQAEKRAETLHRSSILRGPQQTRRNQSGIKRGRKSYITPAFLGIPNKRHKIKAGPKEGGNLTSALHSRGSPTNEIKSDRAEKRAEILHHPCILGDPQQRGQNQSRPKRGRKRYITLAFPGVPNKRDKIKAGRKQVGNATSPLHYRGTPTKGTKSKRAQKRAEMLHHPCILGAPQQRGQNQSAPKRGLKCYITAAFSGIPNKRDKMKAESKEGGKATSPLHSWGSPANDTKSKRAQKRAEILHHPCILGGPQQTR